jgi:imidazolonepropionase
MPGFSDAAIHVSLYQSGASADSTVKRKKSANFYEENITLLRSCLQHGTLNAQFKVSGVGSLAADVAALRQLAAIGPVPVGTVRCLRLFPASVDENKLAALASRLAMLRRRNFVQFLELFAGADLNASASFWELLRKAGLPLNLIWPGGPAEVLQRLLEQARAHCVFCPAELSHSECNVLAQSPSISVFSPCKELLEERENPSAKKLADSGGAIALASGYDSKDAPIFSIQMVVALAVLRLRLSVEQAISATTINAAHALGRGDETGSLEAGKRADLLVLNLSDYREIPRRIGVNQVAMALRDGNFLINRKRAKASA